MEEGEGVKKVFGIRAQIQHLKAYASTEGLKNAVIDPRFQYVTRGCAQYIEWLGQQENPNGKGWAAGAGYGSKILTILGKILAVTVEEKKEETEVSEKRDRTADLLNAIQSRSRLNHLLP